MNIWEKSNEYENYENNINKRNKIFKLHIPNYGIYGFVRLRKDFAASKSFFLVRIFTFGGSHISVRCFFPKEIGKKESQSHKPLQLQDITSRRHVLQALAHFFKRQGSAKSHTPRQRQGSSLTWRLAFCGSYSCGVSNTLISILPRWQGSAPEDPWSAPAKKKDGKEKKTIIEHLGFHCRATCLS